MGKRIKSRRIYGYACWKTFKRKSAKDTVYEEFCSDILILDKGKTVLKGNLKEIKETYPASRVRIDTDAKIEKYIQELDLKIENEKNNEYVIKITDEEKAHTLLNNVISNGIKVNKFDIMKPTLNDIFIEKVGE